MKFKPLQNEMPNVRGHATGSQAATPEPSHIHIPRPSRVRHLELAEPPTDQAVLEDAA